MVLASATDDRGGREGLLTSSGEMAGSLKEARFICQRDADGDAFAGWFVLSLEAVHQGRHVNPHIAPLGGHPRVMAVGGYPIIENGRYIGGLGISGGDYEQDQQAAEEALAAFGFETPPGDVEPTACRRQAAVGC
ncbi:heme-binding protein [Actinacidiphila acidipaludis]|uniref:Heme-binding protein n=1 Tax=Actinacidiphila acidipaludis TaxID=2873382 RepID=A0ABS7QEP6_9ACTN|nr:heme-binding protein [Streptomyces acidipaludis]MBY8881650.1 heme-binding protein [Streptomyces acidipaludis]